MRCALSVMADDAFIAKWLKGKALAALQEQGSDTDPTLESIEAMTTAKPDPATAWNAWMDPRNPELWTSLN